jgi:uncharacterized protein YbaR (Trm112 family)
MILFGTRSIVRVVPHGVRAARFCGKCHAVSELVEHRARRYFTLYFLPVFPIETAEHVLRCSRCKSTYHMAARGDRTPAAETSSRDRDTLSCPYCQQMLRIPARAEGVVTLRCRACRGEFSIRRNAGSS